ncbi:MAG: DUF975 family protein [Lachnospiraceae bacterium]|nr:DUF975 family protein [Lachnospiraceae bacterium]
MNEFSSSAQLKALSKSQLRGNYGIVISVYALHLLITLPLSFVLALLLQVSLELYFPLSFLVSLFGGFFVAGESLVYLKIACHERPAVSDLFYYFRSPYAERGTKVVRVQLVLAAVSTFCSMPFTYVQRALTREMAVQAVQLTADPESVDLTYHSVLFLVFAILFVAGTAIQILVQLLLSQAYYLMLDFPEYSGTQILHLAPKLIKGHKARLFYIMLSFVPLMLLGFCSCGIGMLWVEPYRQTTFANFYLDLVQKRKPGNLQ